MKPSPNLLVSLLAASVMGLTESASVMADDFYRNKSITVLVAGTPGGGFDMISRIMAAHIGKHIPGNPTFIVRDLPGGGGIVAANTLYNLSAKDGTVLAYTGPVFVQPLLDPDNKSIQFDGTKFTWIGSLGITNSVLIAWHTSPIKTASDLFEREMIVNGTGAAATTDIYPKVLNTVLGTKFKLITGYQGTRETNLAIERGEAEGRFIPLDTLEAVSPDWLRDNKAHVILQASMTRQEILQDVPSAADLAKTEEQRQALDFLFLPSDMGRPVAAPPHIPAAQRTILRRAFAQMIKDRDFLAEAQQHGLKVEGPMMGTEVDKTVAKIYATPRETISRVVRAMQ